MKLHNVVIIGSGPAAMSAAIYAAREKFAPVVYERATIGGLASSISKIENYPGFAGTGAELMQIMRKQAESFGARFEYGECTKIIKQDDYFELTIDDERITARTVIVASGTEYRHLGIPGENLPGVSYCATCDAALTKDQEVIVIGGANSAAQESFFLLKYCQNIKMLVHTELKCSEVLKERIRNEPRIETILHVSPQSIEQSGDMLIITSEDGRQFSAKHIFVLAGTCPASRFLPDEVRAEDGGIIVDSNNATTIPGLFAAGDCCTGVIKQAIVAAGAGATAAVNARKYLESQK